MTALFCSYKPGKKELTVGATSSQQPTPTLTLVGYGNMSWQPSMSRYFILVGNLAAPPFQCDGGLQRRRLGDLYPLAPLRRRSMNVVVPRGAQTLASPVVANRFVVTADRQANVRALNADDGRLIWQRATGSDEHRRSTAS